MAVGTDGRYYAEAELSDEARAKFVAKAKAAGDDEKVEPPVADGGNIRENAGSTVPLTGDDPVNPVTAPKSKATAAKEAETK
jgi:hypothetical protein